MSKKLELEAYGHLQKYIGARLPGAVVQPTMNKGRGHHAQIADAVLTYGDRIYHIEIKASSKKVGHNIRFTHQTISKAVGKDFIVALISNMETGSPTFEFFRLSDAVQSLCIEPHFFMASKNTKNVTHPLEAILQSPDGSLDVSMLLNSSVREHTNLRGDEPLWSPYDSAMNADGEPIPPWLKYPRLARTSMGWRMGAGEEHAEMFYEWLATQKSEGVQAYKAKYPTPRDWLDIWELR